jgi:hypothetical protein
LLIHKTADSSDGTVKGSVLRRDELPADYAADWARILQPESTDGRWAQRQEQQFISDATVGSQIEGIGAEGFSNDEPDHGRRNRPRHPTARIGSHEPEPDVVFSRFLK